MQFGSNLTHAAERGDVEAVRMHLDNGTNVDARNVFQTALVHIATRHGHEELLELLISRGACVNALDYGGMRRTPLHWACQLGHVRCVELLVEAGADVHAQGPTWSKLVQGQACGQMIDSHSPCSKSPENLCQQDAVKLALLRPEWNPSIHSQFPKKFRDVARLLIMLAGLPADRNDGPATFGKLGIDECCEILKRLAYPISAWI